VVTEYGPVWVPGVVPVGWAPYSTGRWIWDPGSEWTWIDDAPWGWAPFHYGCWVFIGGYWAWAPGPVYGVSVYAPALVAFFDLVSSLMLSIGFGTPGLAWVSLGWGEPLLPSWGGWWDPRVVNKVVVKQTSVISVTNITYVNSRVNNAVVATYRERFTRGGWDDTPHRLTHTTQTRLQPVRGALPVKPEPARPRAVERQERQRVPAEPPQAAPAPTRHLSRVARQAGQPGVSRAAKGE
jgi:hypothetical protein